VVEHKARQGEGNSGQIAGAYTFNGAGVGVGKINNLPGRKPTMRNSFRTIDESGCPRQATRNLYAILGGSKNDGGLYA
jgi:hypothetical protein